MTKEPTEAQVWHSRYMAAEETIAKLRKALLGIEDNLNRGDEGNDELYADIFALIDDAVGASDAQ